MTDSAKEKLMFSLKQKTSILFALFFVCSTFAASRALALDGHINIQLEDGRQVPAADLTVIFHPHVDTLTPKTTTSTDDQGYYSVNIPAAEYFVEIEQASRQVFAAKIQLKEKDNDIVLNAEPSRPASE